MRHKLGGLFPFLYTSLDHHQLSPTLTYPEPFSRFPLSLLLTTLLSSLLKVAIPLALEFLYKNLSRDNFLIPFTVFILTTAASYWFERESDQLLTLHKLKTREILCERAMGACLRSQSSSENLWSKLSSDLNTYVNNYYGSYICIVFETLKAVLIVAYLFWKMGLLTLVGLGLSGLIVTFTLALSKGISQASFKIVEHRQNKVNILTAFLQRITDYKMSWLDGFVGSLVQREQDQVQRNMRKSKILDCWCVGLWQFTQVGISSIVLCLYYYMNGLPTGGFEPATIIFFFQMITFPMNAISWNIAGINNALIAISHLTPQYLSPNQHHLQHQPSSEKPISLVLGQLTLDIGHIYGVDVGKSNLKSLAQQLKQSHPSLRVGFAEENGFLLPTALQNMLMMPRDHPSFVERAQNMNQQKVYEALVYAECDSIPLNNLTATYSGGEKMRTSLARALSLSHVIVIDSDLTSLDKQTRDQVIHNLNHLSCKGKTFFIKKSSLVDDKAMQAHTFQWLSLGTKLKLQANPSYQKTSVEQPKHRELLDIVARWKNQPIPQQDHNLQQQSASSSVNDHPNLSLKTIKYYYGCMPLHILFVVSIAGMYAIGNYYNYYINVSQPKDPISHALTILYITGIYVLSIALRSYLFAEANLRQSDRICNQTNNLIVYNSNEFYEDGLERSQGERLRESKGDELTDRFVCLVNSDEQSISYSYPFIANIFWNNVMTVIGSLFMIVMEVPVMLLIVLPVCWLVQSLDRRFRRENERLAVAEKEQEISLMRATNYISQGRTYMQLYSHQAVFAEYFHRALHTHLTTSNQRFHLNQWVKINFRLIMLAFIACAISLFLYLQDHDAKNTEAGLAVMARYALLLADYVFHFTISLAECRGNAVSIQRIREYAENEKVIKDSAVRSAQMKAKLAALKQIPVEPISNPIISLRDFTFGYKGQNIPALCSINLDVSAKDKILIKGKTGAGKTTLFKVLTGLYPDSYISPYNHLISFSSQHPLRLPMTSLQESIDPYQILPQAQPKIQRKIRQHIDKLVEKQEKGGLSYEEEVKANNIRAFLYGHLGLVIYDEPQMILEETSAQSTFIAVTHHREFKSDRTLLMEGGKLKEA